MTPTCPHAETRRRSTFTAIAAILLILSTLPALTGDALAGYEEDIDAIDADIAASEAVIASRRAVIADYQASLNANEASLKITQDIYDVGIKKYKDMQAEVVNIEKKFNKINSDLFVLRSTYADFYNAFLAYKDAWYAKNEAQMTIEYRKMWHYLHGFESEPPYRDPVTGFWEVRKWALSVGSRWAIRTLHTVVSAINVAKTVIDIKSQVTGVMSAADEGFKALLDHARDEAIDTVKEEAIENLKAAGSSTSEKVEYAINAADAVSSPLSAAEEELKKMVDRIEKKESFGYPSKEVAIEKMTELLNTTGAVHAEAGADAAKVLAELAPIRNQLAVYRNAIAEDNAAIQTLYGQIEAENAKIRGYQRDRAAVHYTYNVSASSCGTYVSMLSVASVSGSTMSTDPMTEALTGHPTALHVTASANIAGCTVQNAQCQDEHGNDINVSFNTPQSTTTPVDPATLGGEGTNTGFVSGRITPSGPGAGSYRFTLGPRLDAYATSSLDCGVTTHTPTGSGVAETTVAVNTVAATRIHLIPERYMVSGKPVDEGFPAAYHIFTNTSETPYEAENYFVAFAVTGETVYRYVPVDEVTATVSNLTTHPDGIISGVFQLSGYMAVNGGAESQLAGTLTLYAEHIAPEVSFVDYEGQSVTRSEGAVPLDRAVTLSLNLTSGSSPVYGVDDVVQVDWSVGGVGYQTIYENAGFALTDVPIGSYNYKGAAIPVSWVVKILPPGGSGGTSLSGDMGEGLKGAVRVDDIYMTEPGQSTPYLSHKNIFFFDRSSDWIDLGYDLHVKTGTTDFTASFDEDVSDVLFDDRHALGIDLFSEYSALASPNRLKLALKFIGGQVTRQRDKVYETDDFQRLLDGGVVLGENQSAFAAGFNINVVKLRMREHGGHRYFVLRSMGPTDMSAYAADWTFSDGSTLAGGFTRNGMVWESVVEPARNLTSVTLTSPGGMVVGTFQMADLTTGTPALYGIDENQFVITMNDRFDTIDGAWRLTGKRLTVTEETPYYTSLTVQLPIAGSAMSLKKACGVDMIEVSDPAIDGSTVSFYINLFPQSAPHMLTPPSAGAASIDTNRITYSAPDGYTGIDTFSVDLYGALSNPRQGRDDTPENYMDAIDNRTLDVQLDFSGPSPVLDVTTTYKSPIRIIRSLEFDAPVTHVDYDSNVATYSVSTYNDHQVVYTGKAVPWGTFTTEDIVTFNGDTPIKTTWTRSRCGARRIVLPPGQTAVFSKQYLQALFYHMFDGEIEKLEPGPDEWVDGFDYQFKKDGAVVPYVSGGTPMADFDRLEVTFNPADPDGLPAGLGLSGKQGTESESVYIYFFSEESDGRGQGDYDGSGNIDIADVIVVLQLLSGHGGPLYNGEDVNGDGTVGMAEAIGLMRRLSAVSAP